jgi:hypothetical protein
MIAPLIFFNPKFALRTLFEFLPLSKFQELLILLAHRGVYFVLLACHLLVPLHPAIQTILFFALQTFEAFGVSYLEEEHVGTVGSGAPRTRLEASVHRVPVAVCVGLQSVTLVLLEHLRLQDPLQVLLRQFFLALLLGTNYREVVVHNVSLE